MKAKKYILPIIIILLLAVIDQITKYFVIKYISYESNEEIPVIGDLLVLTHIHNSGAAWGSFTGKIPFLLIITAIVTAALIYVYHNIVDKKGFMPIKIGIIAILGGALGNLIDRIRFGYVTDFIYVKVINFPVFNFADICVTVSIFVLLFLFIFKYKNEDFDVILGEKNKKKQDESEE